MSRLRWWWSLVGIASGCIAAEEDLASVDTTDQAIVYGADDRVEVYAHPNPRLREIAASSVVSLIPRERLRQSAAGSAVTDAPLLRGDPGICPGERFAEQPTAADCSGVLIDDDLVLTAGHCIATDQACTQVAFVFGYYYREPGALARIEWADVYGCRRIVSRRLSLRTDAPPIIDYAIVQLDRPARGHVPIAPRVQVLDTNEPLATIGCTSGLPLKIDTGSRARNVRSATMDYFLLDSDTFEGSSGSGVFDANAQLVGVLVRGGRDYVQTSNQCVVPKVVDLRDGSTNLGEEATYVGRAIDGVCATGWPSERLCGIAPRCGDGFCSGGETRKLCPADCACSGAACRSEELARAVTPGAVTKTRAAGGAGCAAAQPRDSGLGLLGSLGVVLLTLRRRRRSRSR